MKVALIVAMDREQGIGKNNDLMWHLPVDMKFFKETTNGHIVVMGRKNFDSIPDRFRPLSNRENVILTHNTAFQAEGCLVFHSLEACLDAYKKEEERTIFIIGGGQIYSQAMEMDCIDEMYITHIDKTFDAETFFPSFDQKKWDITEVFKQEMDEKHEANFAIKHYVKK